MGSRAVGGSVIAVQSSLPPSSQQAMRSPGEAWPPRQLTCTVCLSRPVEGEAPLSSQPANQPASTQ